jgi:hypothetical protein
LPTDRTEHRTIDNSIVTIITVIIVIITITIVIVTPIVAASWQQHRGHVVDGFQFVGKCS